MGTYISILRGINVSGQKKILMTDLKALYEELNFEDVTTYIQSGNVIFKSNSNETISKLSSIIEEKIESKFQFHVPVIIRKVEEMEDILNVNPFLKINDVNPDKLHVTFLDQEPLTEHLDKITNLDFEPDRFTAIGKEIYLYCPGGYGTTKLSNNFFENKLKVKATTRNWRTVNKLVLLAHKK